MFLSKIRIENFRILKDVEITLDRNLTLFVGKNNTGKTSIMDAMMLLLDMPRVGKLKDFLNSAAEKFEAVDHISHMNFLYINWTFSEVLESGFEEALSLLAHPVNGILTHKEMGLRLGVNEEVYDKITAVIVYTESVSGLMFGDLRWIWTRGSDGMPRFGIIGIHNCEALAEMTGMNPFGKQLTPILIYLAKDTKYSEDLIRIIGENLLTSL